MRPGFLLVAAGILVSSSVVSADDPPKAGDLGEDSVTETVPGDDAAAEMNVGYVAAGTAPNDDEDDAGEADEDRYPTRYIDRPLTLANNIIRLDGAIRLDHASEVDASLVLGGAISFAKYLELGLSPHRLGSLTGISTEGALPLVFFQDVDLGSLPIYLRLRLAELDEIDFALDLGSSIPLESSPDITIFGGVLVRARLAKRMILDTGVELRVLFEDNNEVVTLVVPGTFSVQVADPFYLAFRSGIVWPDFKGSLLGIPLGLEAGYVLGGGGKKPIADLVALFEWPSLVVPVLGAFTCVGLIPFAPGASIVTALLVTLLGPAIALIRRARA